MQTSIRDLVNDLRHLVDREKLDWDAILERANTSYIEEQTKP